MVIAEIPLWVVHTSSSGNDVPTPEDWNAVRRSNSKSKEGPTLLAAQQALQSYYYVPPSGNSNTSESLQIRNSAANKKKCAIYSVDVFQNLFCTAGGDGTVRIWSVPALFAGKKRSGMAHFDAETGRYVSSESSESPSSSLEDEESDRSSSPGDVVPPKDALLGSKPPFSVAAPIVHDLNANARSKKKAAALSPPRPTVAAPATSPSPPILSPNRPSKQPQRLLCTLSAHTGSSVLAVRFSHSGQYIASAGDDGCVCIYARTNATEHNTENWSRIKLCRGHNLDVVDLAWSPDDAYLVSCSLDSTTPIIVWKLTDLQSPSSKSMICAPFKVLGQSEHTSTVKGVAFDPAGSYFASSGDDPAVCIWRTHDDWGLEKKIDADAGIFRKWNLHSKHSSTEQLDDVQALSNQSLFRRISWSTDGAFLCSTNSVVKNKHVASTISRELWHVSGSNSNSMEASGAANLVGHKQPIVVSRHSSHLLKVGKNRSKSFTDVDKKANEDDDESNEEHSSEEDVPEYATLLALGDRRGFVSVWSTRKSRPIFKVQCSESHCTVTDLSWGSMHNGDLLLLVSLLDGQVYAFRFAVPDELGSVLTEKEKNQVFQLRYGIDIGDGGHMGDVFGRRHSFGGKSGPNLIENSLQMSLEEARNTNDHEPLGNESELDISLSTSAGANVQQEESRSLSGKKRVRPVLIQVDGSDKTKQQKTNSSQQGRPSTFVTTDPLQSAIMEADKAAAAVENSNLTRKHATDTKSGPKASLAEHTSGGAVVQSHQKYSSPPVAPALRHSTERSYVADLPLLADKSVLAEYVVSSAYVVECVNSSKVPVGSKGGPVSCVDVTISNEGQAVWKDQILGTSCSALAVSRNLFAVGLSDGSIQLYGTSPTRGWSCGLSFRSHAPLILGTAIVSLQLFENKDSRKEPETDVLDMLVVTSDGFFGVWTILPDIQLQYKGSVMPAMTHMSSSSGGVRMPTLSRILVTDSGHLVLLLSLESSTGNRQSSVDRESSNSSSAMDTGSGGSLQGFVYDRKAELWLRLSDSRFVLSDFYSVLPSTTTLGVLSRIDDAVRLGSLHSSLKAAQRSRQYDQHADAIYQEAETDSGNFCASRSHCEDRMACALAMKSSAEFKHWLRLYIRILVMKGQISQLRMLVTMFLHQKGESPAFHFDGESCWWLSLSPNVLGESRLQLVRDIVIPEMSKSRMMQRLTNEIFLEIEVLADIAKNAYS